MFEKLTAEVDVAESIASVILVIAHSSYSTDLSDAAWGLVSPLLPPARTGGRRRTTDLRAVLDAIFYLLRTGCQWRLIPRDSHRGVPSMTTSEIGRMRASGAASRQRS